jgi:hypothetical protein
LTQVFSRYVLNGYAIISRDFTGLYRGKVDIDGNLDTLSIGDVRITGPDYRL